MVREIIRPQNENYQLHIPKEYINKKVEILILPFNEIEEEQKDGTLIDFSEYEIESFSEIKDPVEWQKKTRNEWGR